RGNSESLERDTVVEIERADLRPNLQADHVAGDRRSEVQPDAELLEHDRDGTRRALHDRHREFTARKKARLLAVVGNQVRVGERLEEPLLLEGFDGDAKSFLPVEEEQIQEVAEYQSTRLGVVEVRRRELLRRDSSRRIDARGKEVDAELL